LLGTGVGPGACHIFSGLEVAMNATRSAVQAALDQAGLPGGKAQIYAGGHTGADWPDEYDLLRNGVESLSLAKEVLILNDSIVALRGGTQKPYGAILVAGTGANCAVLAPDGEEFIYHYYHDSHLQGGSAIGRAALNAIFRAETRRPPQTSLCGRVLVLFGLPDVDSLMRSLIEGKISENRIPDIAPIVFDEAEKGDLAARNIVTDFGEGCAELLTSGLQRLGMTHLDVEIVLSGGIFKARSPLLRGTLEKDILKIAPKSRLVEARYEPVVGAVLYALEKMGVNLDPVIQANIEGSAQKLSLLR